MLTFFLLILCVNIDALSYGIAYGLKKKRFKILYILAITTLSTVLFAVPLYFSKFIYEYFDETICHIVNAIILLLLGIYYLIPKNSLNKNKKIFKNKLNTGYLELDIRFKSCNYNVKSTFFSTNHKLNKKSKKQNYSQNKSNKNYKYSILFNKNKLSSKNKKIRYNKKEKNNKTNILRFFCECMAISVDAIFTAFLSGFHDNFYIYAVIFYALSNFFAIFLGNILFYKLDKNFKFNLEFLSGIIFIILGILKIFGF